MEDILSRALDYAVAGNHILAYVEYDAYLMRNPCNYYALTGRGLARMELYDYTGAQKDFSRAVSLYPSHDHAYAVRGDLYCRTLSYEQALKDYSYAVVLNPARSEYLCTRGNIRRKLGLYRESFDDLMRAMQLNPLNTEVYVNLGFLCTDIGKFEDAVKAFGCALIADGDLPEAYYHRAVVLIRNLGSKKEGFHDLCSYSGARKLSSLQFAELMSIVCLETKCFDILMN